MKKIFFKILLVVVLFLSGIEASFAQCPVYQGCTAYSYGYAITLGFTDGTTFPLGATITFTYDGQVFPSVPDQNGGSSSSIGIFDFDLCGEDPDFDITLLTFDLLWTNGDDDCTYVEPPPVVCPGRIQAIPSESVNLPGGDCVLTPGENVVYLSQGTQPNPQPGMNGVKFYFNNSPLLDGTYSSCNSVTQGIDVFDINYQGGPVTLVFAQNDNLTCVYNDLGELCVPEPNQICEPYLGPSCVELFETCGDDLLGLVRGKLNSPALCKQWKESCGFDNSIWRDERIAIGNTNISQDFRLTVRGGIMTDHFRLCNEDNPVFWCDYVFEENYDLWSLPKVEAFIKKNKHLHKTNSAKEIVEDGGFELREVTLDHQEKIEEIFLHLIDLDEQLSEMESKVNKKD